MQGIVTVIILVGLVGMLLIEFGGKRLITMLENSNVSIGADPTKPVTVDVAAMATQFASVRAQIENTEGTAAAEAFVSTYANSIFKPVLSK